MIVELVKFEYLRNSGVVNLQTTCGKIIGVTYFALSVILVLFLLDFALKLFLIRNMF